MYKSLKLLRTPAVWLGYFWLIQKLSVGIHSQNDGFIFGLSCLLGSVPILLASVIMVMGEGDD